MTQLAAVTAASVVVVASRSRRSTTPKRHGHTAATRLGALLLLRSELTAHLPGELRCVSNRSKVMVTCYPGEGARYTRHCDNSNGNGRRLTARAPLDLSSRRAVRRLPRHSKEWPADLFRCWRGLATGTEPGFD